MNEANSWYRIPAEIKHSVLGYVSIPQLAMLGATSREHHRFMKAEIRRRVTGTLTHHGLPEETLTFMKTHRVIISGSVVVDVLQPGTVVPNDIDLFVPLGSLQATHEFLAQRTDFVIQAASEHGREIRNEYDREESGVREVVLYVHQASGKLLNIIESNYAAANAPLFKFHSTCVMNYITHNSVVSAYPLMVEDKVGLVNAMGDGFTRKMVRALIKYALRGFTFLDTAFDWKKNEHDCARYGYCSRAQRRVNDKYTLRICFAEDAGANADVVEGNVRWRLASHFVCGERDLQAPRACTVYVD